MDPITATVMVACGAIKIAQCLADAFEDRGRRRREYTALQQQTAQGDDEAEKQRLALRSYRIENSTDEVLYVLGVLGQRILLLDVVCLKFIPDILVTVNGLWPDDIWKERFGKFKHPLQYATVVGMVFCAECWPMHIYRGFGTSVLNDFGWANPDPSLDFDNGSERYWLQLIANEMDKILASLKSLPRPALLTKIPTGVSTTQPDFNYTDLSKLEQYKLPRKSKKELVELRKHVRSCAASVASTPPQLKSRAFPIRDIKILWATWNSEFCCTSLLETMVEQIYLRQSDPGRLLYAFTIGEHLKMKPGELGTFRGEHIGSLVRFLHGLPGTSFAMLNGTELDPRATELKKATFEFFMSKSINLHITLQDSQTVYVYESGRTVPYKEVDSVSDNSSVSPTSNAPPSYSDTVAPQSPVSAMQKTPTLTKITTTESFSSQTSTNPPLVVRRRPAPKPRDVVLRRAKVKHATDPEDEDELLVQTGMVIDILEDHGDGWLRARLPDGKIGIVPDEFTCPV